MKADYGIPIFRMKTRAIHLGYTAANGINIHINGEIAPPFMISPAKQNKKLSYVMGFDVCAELYETSDFFQQLADSGCYVYVGGFMTRNTEEGVLWRREGAVLGGEANNDVSLFCLAQDKEYDEELKVYVYTFGKERYNEALEEHFIVPGEVFSDGEKERRKCDVMWTGCCQSRAGMRCSKMLWDEAKPKVRSLSREMLKRVVSEDLPEYDLDTMVAFCVNCHLMPWVSYAVLERAGLEVERGGYHAMILDCFFGMDMNRLNLLLKESGRSGSSARMSA